MIKTICFDITNIDCDIICAITYRLNKIPCMFKVDLNKNIIRVSSNDTKVLVAARKVVKQYV